MLRYSRTIVKLYDDHQSLKVILEKTNNVFDRVITHSQLKNVTTIVQLYRYYFQIGASLNAGVSWAAINDQTDTLQAE